MHDCFISYSHKDSPVATAIQNLLEQQGLRCWIDFRDAVPGKDYAASIVQAIRACKVFILVLSRDSAVSTHVLNEINSAANSGKTILPFKIDDEQLGDSMQYYLGATHWLDALTPPLEAHILALAETIKTITAAEVSRPQPTAVPAPKEAFGSCRCLKYEDLLELGYTASSIALQLVENDYINCNGISHENEGTAQQWETYLQNNTETFRYLLDGENKIVGNWSIVALTADSFAAAVEGQLLESSLDIDKTEMLCFPGDYYGYLLAVSLLPGHRSMKNYNLLVDSFLQQLEEYAENGIFFKSWCMNVFGKEVEALIRGLGFTHVADNKVHGKIYTCSFSPLPQLPIFQKYEQLTDAYKNHFSE